MGINLQIKTTYRNRTCFDKWSFVCDWKVGMTRFELATSASRTQRSTRLSHIPWESYSIMTSCPVNAVGYKVSRLFDRNHENQ